MRRIILFLLFLHITSIAYALPLSTEVIQSCLSVEAVLDAKVVMIPTNERYQEDNYKNGYSADYVTYHHKDIGYATKKNQHAVVYDGQLFPLNQAQYLEPGKPNFALPEINPDLADWLLVDKNNQQFLCISDNFAGLGRSGSYQKVRYAYLLSLTGKKVLYFTAEKLP